jgi:thiamine-phosphate diphosphorylase
VREVPRGVWAIADQLSADAADAWMDGAQAADAWTWRRPLGDDGDAWRMGRTLRARAPWLAVHARADLAQLIGADAVLAGARSLPIEVLARRWGRQAEADALGRLGASVHDEAERTAALQAGADFLFFGPVWETPSKRGILPPAGIDALRRFVEEVAQPVLAIGGVETPEQVAAAHAAGAHGVAVLRAAREPARLRTLVDAWRERDALR